MSTPVTAKHHRPPARAFGRLVSVQARLTWRDPLLPLLGLGLPIFLLVVSGIVPAFKGPAFGDARFTLSGYYMPLWICLSVSTIALFCLPTPFVADRENHWLRRISTTPAPPSWLLGAQIAVNVVLALLAVAVLTFGSVAFFGVRAPAQTVGYGLTALLLIAAMFALGVFVTAVARTAGVVLGLGQTTFQPLLFLGGVWVPREILPAGLRTIGDYTPIGAASTAMRDAMLGAFPAALDLLVLVAWAVVWGAAGVRFFRWE
jgi:ABC-2 type transport system permease protein